MTHPDSIVFGAAGFIGRALVARLLGDGHRVAAAVRPGGAERLTSWLAEQGVDQAELTVLTSDIAVPGLGLDPAAALDDIREVYNCAARFAFGLDPAEARWVNVDGALHVLDWAAARPGLRRLVHISGYRVDSDIAGDIDYGTGAYEASKGEGDRLLRERAAAIGAPLTIANPSTVIGPGQYIGLAEMVEDLWNGRLPAVPGGTETFVPIVDLNFFVRFLARLPELPESAGRSYTVLDQNSPTLPGLVRSIAAHLHVPAPRFTVPTRLVATLPKAVTGADRERLAFLAEDGYDTGAADALARSAGIHMPPTESALLAWADHLVAARFGRAHADPTAGSADGTWLSGDRRAPDYVFLHGLPLDGDSWNPVRELLPASSLAMDLPGLGRSAPRPGSSTEWLDELLAGITTRPVLVGHSLGCGPVLRYAAAHPEKVSGIALVSPYFLQDRPGMLEHSPLAAPLLRRLPAARLAERLAVPHGPAIDSAAANLHRLGVATRTATALRAAAREDHRAELRELLRGSAVPVQLIAASDNPLTVPADAPVTVVDSAGHYPQLTHPAAVAAAVSEALIRT
ncbi:alpha/beta fold hydrolase [Nocardia crassostreae]|uniref:alpha/beta fold hydrolase n=1 Tax=Nocardia crassostreae TaxID=53428 RepID=UPI00082B54A1|nr:alpha/beta fold hydrolase [Nocardia crassostreae]